MTVLATSIQGGLDPNPIAQANLAEKYFFPTTGEVTGSYMEEAYQGVGSAIADYRAFQIKQEDATNFEPLNKELYESSPYYRPSVKFYQGMTNGAAKILAENSDEQEARNFIMSKATGGQTALGYISAFGAGVLEPKNVATGVAASAVLSPVIGWVAPVGSSLKRVLAMKKIAGNYGAKAGIGAAEGFVSAAMTEPLNRSSAKTLQQDYTMMDTMLNIGLSSAFGAGFNTVPSYIKEKWDLHGAKTPEVMAAEHDTAVTQLATGSKVDVSEVNRAALGDISTKPVAEQIKLLQKTIDLTSDKYFDESALFNAKNQNSKSRDILVYLTPDEFLSMAKEGFSKDKAERVKSIVESGGKFSDIPQISFENDGNGFAYVTGHEGRHRAKYLKEIGVANMPVVLRSTTFNPIDRPTIRWGELGKNSFDDFIAQGWTFPNKIRQQDGDAVYDFPINLDDIRNSSDRINSTNKTASQKYYQDTISKNNDTAIDQKAISQLKDFEDNLLTDSEKMAIDDYEKHIAELDAMEAEGILTAREELMNAIDGMNEADIEEAYNNLHFCLTRG